MIGIPELYRPGNIIIAPSGKYKKLGVLDVLEEEDEYKPAPLRAAWFVAFGFTRNANDCWEMRLNGYSRLVIGRSEKDGRFYFPLLFQTMPGDIRADRFLKQIDISQEVRDRENIVLLSNILFVHNLQNLVFFLSGKNLNTAAAIKELNGAQLASN